MTAARAVWCREGARIEKQDNENAKAIWYQSYGGQSEEEYSFCCWLLVSFVVVVFFTKGKSDWRLGMRAGWAVQSTQQLVYKIPTNMQHKKILQKVVGVQCTIRSRSDQDHTTWWEKLCGGILNMGFNHTSSHKLECDDTLEVGCGFGVCYGLHNGCLARSIDRRCRVQCYW